MERNKAQKVAATEPLVSVVIPAYNAEKFVGNMINDLISQTYHNFEVIVVDDGSTDKTASVVKRVARTDKRIKLVNQPNQGASAARNHGIELARGKFVFFFDADDKLDSRILEKMIAAAQANPNSLVICGKYLNQEKQPLPFSGLVHEKTTTFVLKSLLKNDYLYSPWNKVYHLDLVKRYNIRFETNTHYGEDLIFNLEYLCHSQTIYGVKTPLYHYKLSSNGLSQSSSKNWNYRQSMLRALKIYLKQDNNFKNNVLLLLVKLRWGLSVIKNNLRGGRG